MASGQRVANKRDTKSRRLGPLQNGTLFSYFRISTIFVVANPAMGVFHSPLTSVPSRYSLFLIEQNRPVVMFAVTKQVLVLETLAVSASLADQLPTLTRKDQS